MSSTEPCGDLFRITTIGVFNEKPLRHISFRSTQQGADDYVEEWSAKGREVVSVEHFKLVQEKKPTPSQISSACLSYRHDFGLLPPEVQNEVRFEATEWLRAWEKEGF